MLRVIADTNIVISGLFFPGNEEKLIQLALSNKIGLILPEYVIMETRSWINQNRKKLGFTKAGAENLQLLLQHATLLSENDYKQKIHEAQSMIRDPKDAPILAAVLSTPHDYFVSGDQDFRVLGLPTHVSTRELLKRIHATPGVQ